jgi:hypothetical protein
VPPGPDGELVTYETRPGPFCGRCDTLKISAASNGRVLIEQGYWAGDYRDWRVVRRSLRVKRAQFARFRSHLAPYRPVGEHWLRDQEGCTPFMTDMPEILVSWRGSGADGRLWFNLGCDPEKWAPLARALTTAPTHLGIRNLPVPNLGWIATTPM